MIALHLLLFAYVVAVAAPATLGTARWVYRCPRLGIAAWYAALTAATTGAGAAVVAAVIPWHTGEAPLCAAWRWCTRAARGEFGAFGRTAAVVILLVAAGLGARVVLCAVRLARAGAARRRHHLQLLDLAGRRSAELGATVVECPEPAAYLIAGRRRRIVLTSGALDVLSSAEVAAVVAHERAHAAGRHDLLLSGVTLLHTAFPTVALFAVARTHLSRLVEMRADEVAVKHHPPIDLARALVTMATATAMSARPAGAVVAASGGNAAERLRRLLEPPAELPAAQRAILAAGFAVVALAPALLLVAARVFPVLDGCLPVPQ